MRGKSTEKQSYDSNNLARIQYLNKRPYLLYVNNT
ncbi:predicted protein [Botrytis cinerea T4]|uniref:Uncharacterized protein n=1 Tax=Botryotinia fuckeliana (strain T4) TaxID=999810 RepID=G2YE34_BOTF4|nr:predicted protein [Botrytis cinerea T4]